VYQKSTTAERADALDAITEFCRTFYQEEELIMAAFQVYCDESGELHDKKCVSFAAAIFPQDEVAVFNRKWKSLLGKVRCVSMKEAMHYEGEFKDWKGQEHDRDGLLESLAILAQERVMYHTNSTLDAATFASFDPRLQGRLKGISYAGFEALVKNIAQGAERNMPDAHFHLVYDLSETYSVECLKLFTRLRMMHSLYRSRFTALSFADDCDYPPLQAADMLAYASRHALLDTNKPIIRRLIEVFKIGRPEFATELAYAADSELGDGIIALPRS
jgi:hypothetical protein